MSGYLKPGFILLLALFSTASVQAVGGTVLSTTRAIYPANIKQTSLSISNSGTKGRYLVDSWTENSVDVKEKSFVVMPPLFVSKPRSENTLRTIYAGVPLSKGRESLFWMNVKTTPPVNKNSLEGRNVLQLVILSRTKPSVCPGNLPQIPEDTPGMLKFPRTSNHLKINDPSAYYAILVNLNMGKTKIDNAMVAPKSDAQVLLPTGAQGNATFQTINDYGAVIPAQTISVC